MYLRPGSTGRLPGSANHPDPGYGDFKGAVAEVVVEYFRPIREKALELLEDEKHLIDLLHEGAGKARAVAAETLHNTYKNLGLVK